MLKYHYHVRPFLLLVYFPPDRPFINRHRSRCMNHTDDFCLPSGDTKTKFPELWTATRPQVLASWVAGSGFREFGDIIHRYFSGEETGFFQQHTYGLWYGDMVWENPEVGMNQAKQIPSGNFTVWYGIDGPFTHDLPLFKRVKLVGFLYLS